jgi:alpha-N-acetylglucosaminidase
MRTIFIALLIAGAYASQEAAASGVLQRLIGSRSSAFVFHIDTSLRSESVQSDTDRFRAHAANGTVYVNATSGVGLTAGAYWYLKNVTNCLVSWGENRTGDQLNLPDALPDVPLTSVETIVPLRYAWNMCTFDYSAAWWGLDRWTREIDWMALHGINLPLALIGQEYVWMQVFESLGVSLEDLESWFTGPAFLAWQRAGNIRKFAGPLSRRYLESQRDLQKNILKLMRDLGMKPVLPCFSGHVPKAVLKVFPNATLTHSPPWNGFPSDETDVYMVDPTQPEFVQIGKLFMQGVIKTFGPSGYYSCDTFNEVDPTSTSHQYLAASAKAVVDSIRDVDASGVWVMQAWLFHFGFWTYDRVQAYLSGAPNDAMIILDLNSEDGALAPKFDQYFGKKWIWNMLHNYGGVRGMYGNLSRIATGPLQDLNVPNSTMIGIGFTPEAIEQNPIMYELLTETFYHRTPVDVSKWLHDYVVQRYGASNNQTLRTWQLLRAAVYNQPGEPRTELEKLPTWQQPDFGWKYGSPPLMTEACEMMLQAAATLDNVAVNGPFQYDLVDVVRQTNTMFFTDVHRVLTNIFTRAWYNGENLNVSQAEPASRTLLNIISGLDRLLGTNPNYLLGMWTTRATDRATSKNESELFMYNARNQVTLWGPTGQITDYAAKAWHGLYGEYYYMRWKSMIQSTFSQGVQNWNSYSFDYTLLQAEQAWCANSSALSSTPTGEDAVAIANELLANMTGDVSTYTPHVGSLGGSPCGTYQPMWTTRPEQLVVLCDLDPECQGFDTNGFLRKEIMGFMPQPGTTTFTKIFSVPRN